MEAVARKRNQCGSKELRISANALEDIKSLRLPISDVVGVKMLYELFPQMAV